MKDLKIIKENEIHNKWMEIKSQSKEEEIDIESIDILTQDILSQLGALTMKGYDSVDGVDIDTYKNRVWGVIENTGLLPEYRGEEEEA